MNYIDMNNFDQFRAEVFALVEECPRTWRRGQSVFNVVDANWGVARAVQFQDGIDCFYDDEKISDFLEAAFKRIQEK